MKQDFFILIKYMSFAPQNDTNDITDTLNGSLTTWYANVDSALKASECVPGYYEYNQAPSYGTQCPIHEGGSTKIDIATARFNVISLDNSYIDVEFTVPVTIPLMNDANHLATQGGFTEKYTYYVGFKSAFDLIDSYRIYSNGDLVYTQNHANFESFLNYVSLTDSAKENSPCYATMSKIQRMKPEVPGTYITIEPSQSAATTIDTKLKFKIPVNSFMMLQNLKWFPGFMGQLTIEIFPTFKNLIWCKVGGFTAFAGDILDGDKITGAAVDAGQAINAHPNECDFDDIYQYGHIFTQINSPCNNHASYDNNAGVQAWGIDTQTFTANSSTLDKFHLYLAFYMLKMDVYNALEYNYLQVPLLFPIQTVSNVKFTSPLGTNTNFTLQNTATLSHCDTVFVVFPYDVNSRTCFMNPQLNCQLNINGKYYPRERYNTVDDPRFMNMELDALNINNNPLFSISDDVAFSITPFVKATEINHTDNCYYSVYNYHTGDIKDKTNFFIGVPLSTDEDFMGGISSNGSTVQVELVGSRGSHNTNVNNENWTQAPEALFLEDRLLKIYSMKPAGRKQIDITSATLEQVSAGAL